MFLRSIRTAVSLVVLSSALTTVNAISDDDFHSVIASHNALLQRERATSFPTYINVDNLKKGNPATVVAPNTVLIADEKDYFDSYATLDNFFKANPDTLFRLNVNAAAFAHEQNGVVSRHSFFNPHSRSNRSFPHQMYLSNLSGGIEHICFDAKYTARILGGDSLKSLVITDFSNLKTIGSGILGSNAGLEFVKLGHLPALTRVDDFLTGCTNVHTVDFSDLSDAVTYSTENGFCGGEKVKNFITPSPCGENAMKTIHQLNVKQSPKASTLKITLN